MNNNYEMHGVVRIYDENHQLIQEKNNMIVKTGRSLICNAIYNSATLPELKYFYETGTTTSLTVPETEYNVDASKQVKCTKEISDDGLSITFTAKITSETAKTLTNPILAVGLCWIDKETKLFSRAAIDPVYMNSNRSYTIEHTVYF